MRPTCRHCGCAFTAQRPVHNDCEARAIDRMIASAQLYAETDNGWEYVATVKPISAPKEIWRAAYNNWLKGDHSVRHEAGYSNEDLLFLRQIGVQP